MYTEDNQSACVCVRGCLSVWAGEYVHVCVCVRVRASCAHVLDHGHVLI